MSKPLGEIHEQNNWILKEKKIVKGKGISGVPVTSNYTLFECKECGEPYTRFVDMETYEGLEVGFDDWVWDWDRVA